MNVSPVQGMNDISTAVWFATLFLTNYKCYSNGGIKEDNIFLVQNTIKVAAFQMLNGRRNVNGGQISQHCTGDYVIRNGHGKNAYPIRNYLKEDGHAPRRRLTAIGEFDGIREHPEELVHYDKSVFDIIDKNKPVYSKKGSELWHWYQNEYIPFIKQLNNN